MSRAGRNEFVPRESQHGHPGKESLEQERKFAQKLEQEKKQLFESLASERDNLAGERESLSQKLVAAVEAKAEAERLLGVERMTTKEVQEQREQYVTQVAGLKERAAQQNDKIESLLSQLEEQGEKMVLFPFRITNTQSFICADADASVKGC